MGRKAGNEAQTGRGGRGEGGGRGGRVSRGRARWARRPPCLTSIQPPSQFRGGMGTLFVVKMCYLPCSRPRAHLDSQRGSGLLSVVPHGGERPPLCRESARPSRPQSSSPWSCHRTRNTGLASRTQAPSPRGKPWCTDGKGLPSRDPSVRSTEVSAQSSLTSSPPPWSFTPEKTADTPKCRIFCGNVEYWIPQWRFIFSMFVQRTKAVGIE